MDTNDLYATRRARARAFLDDRPAKGKAWSEKRYEYERDDQMYLGWVDFDPKKTAADKVGEAIAAYVEKFKTRPNVVLVNEADRAVEVRGVTVRSEGYIRRNNYWIGIEEGYRVGRTE